MIKSGLNKITPNSKDYSLLHSFGSLDSDPKSLPVNFSIYDGRPVPNQNTLDTRFIPSLPPLPMGCTGETGAFESGIQDGKLYNPKDLYEHTTPFDSGGRDIRQMFSTLINRGLEDDKGDLTGKRSAYFNCYGSGAIDDFDAVRFGLWINQNEKRGVYIGSWWYWGAYPETTLPLPSFKLSEASLHCYLVTGWLNDSLEIIPWVGREVGDGGRFYMSRVIFNALMGQPYTGAFTITKSTGVSPIAIGAQAWIDHLVYYIRTLFKV